MLSSADGYNYMSRAFRVFLQHWLEHHPAPPPATTQYFPKPPTFGEKIPAVCDCCAYFRAGETVLHFGHANKQGCCLACGMVLDVSGTEMEIMAALEGDADDGSSGGSAAQWALANHETPTGTLVDRHARWHKWCTRMQELTVDSIKLALVVLAQKRALDAPRAKRRNYSLWKAVQSHKSKVHALELFTAPLPPSAAFRTLLHADIDTFLDKVMKAEMISDCKKLGMSWPPPGVPVMKDVDVWSWEDDVRVELDEEKQHFSGMQKTGRKTKGWVSEKRAISGKCLQNAVLFFLNGRNLKKKQQRKTNPPSRPTISL